VAIGVDECEKKRECEGKSGVGDGEKLSGLGEGVGKSEELCWKSELEGSGLGEFVVRMLRENR